MQPAVLAPRAVGMIRWALHVFVIGLLFWSAAGLPRDHPNRGLVWAAALSTIAIVIIGIAALPELRTTALRRPARTVWVRVWLLALLLGWVVLLWLSPIAAYVAFPLFFLSLHLLGPLWGRIALTVELIACVAFMAHHLGALTWTLTLGPTIGAVVAAATVATFEALVRESDHRQRLIDELEDTRAHLAAAEREAGVHTERERLAGEIHDTLAQSFQGISLLLASAHRSLPDDPDRALPLIDQARESAVAGLGEARRLVAALAPADLSHATLADALSRLAARSSGGDLEVTFTDDAPPLTRPPEVDAALLRVAQSALANVVQHARASSCAITLSAEGLAVVDNGRGFDPAAASAGYGLELMRGRLQRVGGELVVSSTGHGTTVMARWVPGHPSAG